MTVRRWVNVIVDAARAVVGRPGSSGSGTQARTTTSRRGAPTRSAAAPAAQRSPRPAPPAAQRSPRPAPPSAGGPAAAATVSGGYPGDYDGPVRAVYDPHPDGNPDPGEIVWTWVPYEDDHEQGKDRPVLLVGRDGEWLLALQLTSQDHDRDAQQEARAGRVWMDIGSGPWDKQGRPSEVRLNRVIRVAPQAVRREGAVMDRALFLRVADAMAAALR